MENIVNKEEIEIQRIMNFIAHCNNFLDGKYLFATSKLKEISEDIHLSSNLTMLKNECLDGFNASLFKTKCLVKLPTKNGTFTSPTEKEDFIAIAFTFIDDICNELVDYDNFTAKYFYSDKNENKFAKQIIEPLKIVVAKLFNLPEDNEAEFVINTLPESVPHEETKCDNSGTIAVVKNLQNLISESVCNEIHKNNMQVVLEQLLIALEEDDRNLINALKIAIGYMQEFLPEYEYMFEELEFCLNKIS